VEPTNITKKKMNFKTKKVKNIKLVEIGCKNYTFENKKLIIKKTKLF